MTNDQNKSPPASTDKPEAPHGKPDGEFVGPMDTASLDVAAVNIQTENVHFQPNNLAEIASLADRHPELAAKIVDNDNAKNIRETRSFMLGMVVTGLVAISVVGFATWALVSLGWWQSLMLIGVLLGVSHVLRTILKGEWSDTSWLAKLLGVKPPKDP